MNEFLTPGEKVKMLRTELGLTQEDLTDETVSKSLISMIEKEKRGLTLPTAIIIADILNIHYKSMGKKITPEYLMESKDDQIRREINKNLDILNNGMKNSKVDIELLKNTLERVLELVKLGDFQKELMEVKILRGNFHYDNYQYKEAIQDYVDVLDYSMKVGDYGQVARVYNLLGRTYQMLWVLDSAIVHYAKAFETARANNTPNQDKIQAQSMFNQIVCYKNLKRFDLALSHIDIFKKRVHWNDPLFKVYTHRVFLIEANTYRDTANHYSAEQVYKSLLDIRSKLDSETLFLLYENYGLYHRKLGNKSLALKYFEKALQMKEKVNVKYLPALYLYQATCYNLEEEYEKMVAGLEEGLALAELVSRKNMMIEIRFAFVEMYIRLKDYEAALKQLRMAEKIVDEIVAKPILNDLHSYYSEVYNKLGDEEKCTEYLTKIRQKNYLGY